MSGEEGRNRGIRTSRTSHSLFPLLSATELPEVTKVLNCKKIGRVRGWGGGGYQGIQTSRLSHFEFPDPGPFFSWFLPSALCGLQNTNR